MKGTDGAVEALMVLCMLSAMRQCTYMRAAPTIYNRLQGLLQLLMCLSELAVLAGQPKRTRVHELESDLNRNASVVCHVVPVLSDVLEHVFNALTSRTVVVLFPATILPLPTTPMCLRTLQTCWARHLGSPLVRLLEVPEAAWSASPTAACWPHVFLFPHHPFPIATRPPLALTLAARSLRIRVVSRAHAAVATWSPLGVVAGASWHVVFGRIHATVTPRPPRSRGAW